MMTVDITYDIETVKEYMDEKDINDFVSYIIKNEYGEEYDKNDYYVSILLTNNNVIQKINLEYRGKDSPTDVISFAYNETENISVNNILGDIVISIDRVNEQAVEYEHSEKREFYYVLCHGMLHLLGYDHIKEEDKKIMREKEENILTTFDYIRE